MPAESLRQRAVASVAAKIQERMGPLVGSPEYLADPVKRARSEKRQRDAAEAYAEFAVESVLSEILPLIREAGAAGRELADKLWVLRCDSPDHQAREAAERAISMWEPALAKIKELIDAEG